MNFRNNGISATIKKLVVDENDVVRQTFAAGSIAFDPAIRDYDPQRNASYAQELNDNYPNPVTPEQAAFLLNNEWWDTYIVLQRPFNDTRGIVEQVVADFQQSGAKITYSGSLFGLFHTWRLVEWVPKGSPFDLPTSVRVMLWNELYETLQDAPV